MSSNTPRMRSGYPSTPQSTAPQHVNATGPKLPDITALLSSRSEPDAPAVPLEWIDGPTQRLCVAGFFVSFLLWRLYDFYHLTLDDTESMWLFLKWIAIDGVCLFGLPGLRIPWLEWSQTTMLVLFSLHAIVNGILMFRIPVYMSLQNHDGNRTKQWPLDPTRFWIVCHNKIAVRQRNINIRTPRQARRYPKQSFSHPRTAGHPCTS